MSTVLTSASRQVALAATTLCCVLACGSKSGLTNAEKSALGGAAGMSGMPGTGGIGVAGMAGAGGTGNVAASLDGLRWELPCLANASPTVCDTNDSLSLQTTLKGTPGQLYAVRLRQTVER